MDPVQSPPFLERMRQRGLALYDRGLQVPGARLILRMIGDIATSGLTDRAMTLAAQAFTSVLPFAILMTTVPIGRRFLDKAFEGFGMNPENLGLPPVDTTQRLGAFGWFGALMVIAGATSLSRALGRMYLSAWQVEKLNWRGWWRWVAVLFLIPAAVVAQGLITPVHEFSLIGRTWYGFGVTGLILEIIGTVIIWSVLWTVIPRLLVSTQVPMRLLAVNGVLTSIFITIYLIGSRVVLPRTMPETTRHYGTLGVVFVTISWLFFYTCILVASATIMNTIVTDDGFLGRHLSRFTGRPTPFPPAASIAFGVRPATSTDAGDGPRHDPVPQAEPTTHREKETGADDDAHHASEKNEARRDGRGPRRPRRDPDGLRGDGEHR
ncbi:hypothetical protein ABLE92_11685 [Gordonia sp. VNQ95]|jgi:membrane protein|uniref:hypothetical protein n=1 Tax=Gordonia sp. VNQ95 TaxID=3156619 RepID=UPI0032B62660